MVPPKIGHAYGYDANGNVTSVKRPADTTPTLITYDQIFNKPLSITPPVGAPTQFTLDPNDGNVLTMSRGGLSMTYTYDSFGNRLCTNNGRTNYCDQRNSDGLLSSVFDAHNPETRTYDSRKRVASRSFLSGRTIQYVYDDYDRVVQEIDSHGPDTTNVYDAVGRLTQKTVTDGSSNQVTSYTYDARDRLVTITDPLNRTTTYHYNPIKITDKPIRITDPAGRNTRFFYDKRERLIEKIDANNASTKFTYNDNGDLTSVTDANGGVTEYAYDLNYRKIREVRPSVAGTSPVRQVTEYFYDSADRLTKIRKPSATRKGYSREIKNSYDNLDRLVRRLIQREENYQYTTEDDSIFTYEAQLDAERMTSAINGVATLGFTNEAAPPYSVNTYSVNATQFGNPLGLIEGSFAVGRDVTGEIASVAKNGDSIFAKEYDPAGRLTNVEADGGFNAQIGYDGFGRKSSIAHADGTNGAWAYDLLNRITNVNWSGGSLSSPISQALTYNLAGNIEQMVRENGTYTLGYDDVDQLISSATTGAVNYNRTWTVDLLGNRLQDSANGAGSFVSNYLTANGVSNFLADPDGYGDTVRETTGSVVKNYTYRADGKIASFLSGNLAVNYLYDGLNRLAAKAVNDNGNQYTQSFAHLADENRVLLGKAGDASVTTYLDGQGISERLGEVKNGVGKAYITDQLGSVLNSTVAGASNTYGLFGELSTNTEISTNSNAAVYGFTGHMVDLESGLNRTKYRQYDTKVGRWLSQDPMGLNGGDENLYRYVINSPLLFTDATGLIRNPWTIIKDALDHPDSSSGTQDKANAFQHCFASCMMKAENGGLAAFLLGHAFEIMNNFDGQSSADWAMDVSNNASGRDLADSCPSNLTSFNGQKSRKIYNQCASSCKKADLFYMDFSI